MQIDIFKNGVHVDEQLFFKNTLLIQNTSLFGI